MTEKIVGAQYRVVAPDSENSWEVGTVVTLTSIPEWTEKYAEFTDLKGTSENVYWYEVELITPAETEPNSLDSLAQDLNTLVTEHGMATVASALQKWVDFHSKEQK